MRGPLSLPMLWPRGPSHRGFAFAPLAAALSCSLAALACEPAPADGPKPETPASISSTNAGVGPVENTGAVAEASADVSPPFVPAAPSGAPSFSCPTKIAARTAVASPPVPSGWVVLPGEPDADTLRCANLSRKEWLVKRGSSDVEISLAAKRSPDDPLPFPLAGKAKDGLAGTRRVKSIDGGYLVGFDAGEYGGALWWFGSSGDRRQRLSEENVIGFAELGGAPVAVTGLAHLGITKGRVLRMAPDGFGGFRIAAWVDLGGAAQTFVSEGRESMLMQTTSGLMRITACGDLSVLGNSKYDVLYPTSMALDDAGVVTIGMRHFVVRWIPDGRSYREEWLTRIDCARSRVKKFECVCGG